MTPKFISQPWKGDKPGAIDRCPDWATGSLCAFVTPALIAVGVGEATAAIAGPALLGAGLGAATSAISGGNPLTGALIGGVTGGAGGALFGGAGSMFGSSADAGVSGIAGASGEAGDLALAGGAGISPATTLASSSAGAASGGIGGVLSSAGDWISNQASGLFGSGAATPSTASINSMASQLGTTADSSGILQSGPFAGMSVTDPEVQAAISQTSASTAGIGEALSGSGAAGSGTGSSSGLSSLASAGSKAGKGVDLTSLALGALSAGSSMLNKPQQYPIQNVTGPLAAQTANTPLFNAPLSTAGAGTQRTLAPVNLPIVTGAAKPGAYSAYGGPAQNYFNDNQISLPYAAKGGYFKGGALARHAKGGDHAVSTRHGDHYVHGDEPGQSDQQPAMLSDGEWIADANFVSALGDGNSNAGSKVLYDLRKRVMQDKGIDHQVPPKLKKSALSYVAESQKRVMGSHR